MIKEELIEFLKDELSIEISDSRDCYSSSTSFYIKLKLGNEEISRDWFSIKEAD